MKFNIESAEPVNEDKLLNVILYSVPNLIS